MFEPLSAGSERPQLPLLAVSCGLKPRLPGDNLILFQTKNVKLPLSLMHDGSDGSILTQYNSVYVITERSDVNLPTRLSVSLNSHTHSLCRTVMIMLIGLRLLYYINKVYLLS